MRHFSADSAIYDSEARQGWNHVFTTSQIPLLLPRLRRGNKRALRLYVVQAARQTEIEPSSPIAVLALLNVVHKLTTTVRLVRMALPVFCRQFADGIRYRIKRFCQPMRARTFKLSPGSSLARCGSAA